MAPEDEVSEGIMLSCAALCGWCQRVVPVCGASVRVVDMHCIVEVFEDSNSRLDERARCYATLFLILCILHYVMIIHVLIRQGRQGRADMQGRQGRERRAGGRSYYNNT